MRPTIYAGSHTRRVPTQYTGEKKDLENVCPCTTKEKEDFYEVTSQGVRLQAHTHTST